jgi:hypothetical protein
MESACLNVLFLIFVSVAVLRTNYKVRQILFTSFSIRIFTGQRYFHVFRKALHDSEIMLHDFAFCHQSFH